MPSRCSPSSSSTTSLTTVTSNQVFIKFPGRDIGGAWAVFLPLATDAWLATLAFTLVLPMFLFLCYRLLTKYNFVEKFSFGYGQNVFILLNAFSQQVTNKCLPKPCEDPLSYFTSRHQNMFPCYDTNHEFLIEIPMGIETSLLFCHITSRTFQYKQNNYSETD